MSRQLLPYRASIELDIAQLNRNKLYVCLATAFGNGPEEANEIRDRVVNFIIQNPSQFQEFNRRALSFPQIGELIKILGYWHYKLELSAAAALFKRKIVLNHVNGNVENFGNSVARKAPLQLLFDGKKFAITGRRQSSRGAQPESEPEQQEDIVQQTPEEYALEHGFELGRVAGDGSCFYRALSLLLDGNEDLYYRKRQLLALELCSDYARHEETLTFNPAEEQEGYWSMPLFLEWIMQRPFYAGEREWTVIARALNIILFVHRVDKGSGPAYVPEHANGAPILHVLLHNDHFYALTPINQQQSPQLLSGVPSERVGLAGVVVKTEEPELDCLDKNSKPKFVLTAGKMKAELLDLCSDSEDDLIIIEDSSEFRRESSDSDSEENEINVLENEVCLKGSHFNLEDCSEAVIEKSCRATNTKEKNGILTKEHRYETRSVTSKIGSTATESNQADTTTPVKASAQESKPATSWIDEMNYGYCQKCDFYFWDIRKHGFLNHRFLDRKCPFCKKICKKKKDMAVHVYQRHRFVTGLYEPVPIKEEFGVPELKIHSVIAKDYIVIPKSGFKVFWEQSKKRPLYVEENFTPQFFKHRISNLPQPPYKDEANIKLVSPYNYDWLKPGRQVAGHLAAKANHLQSVSAMEDTFSTINIVPMDAKVNCGAWAFLEGHVRKIAKKYDRTSVLSGPIYGEENSEMQFEDLKISVPTAFFKIIVLRRNGEADKLQVFLVDNYYKGNQFFTYKSTLKIVQQATGIEFTGLKNLELTWNIRNKAFICPIPNCWLTFLLKEQLEEHSRVHQCFCRICNKSIGSLDEWEEHKKSHPKFTCTYPGCTFKSVWKGALTLHFTTHSTRRPFRCIKCSKRFANKGQCTVHMYRHRNDRKFGCKECPLRFKTLQALKNHRPAHTEERKYSCDKCDKTFKWSAHFYHHKKSCQQEERTFKCNECSKSFFTKQGLKQHQLTHGEKTLPCKICGKLFRTASTLKVHVRYHSKDRPYVCEICGHASKTPGDLKKHILTHTRKTQFKCSICHEIFERRGELRRHHYQTHKKQQ